MKEGEIIMEEHFDFDELKFQLKEQYGPGGVLQALNGIYNVTDYHDVCSAELLELWDSRKKLSLYTLGHNKEWENNPLAWLAWAVEIKPVFDASIQKVINKVKERS